MFSFPPPPGDRAVTSQRPFRSARALGRRRWGGFAKDARSLAGRAMPTGVTYAPCRDRTTLADAMPRGTRTLASARRCCVPRPPRTPPPGPPPPLAFQL